MPYRNPDPSRMERGKATLFEFAGQTAVLQSYVSSSSGVPAAGIPAKSYFTEHTISALFAMVEQVEHPTLAGMIASDKIQVSTEMLLGRKDRLVWRGILYEIDADAAPMRIGMGWATIMNRASP